MVSWQCEYILELLKPEVDFLICMPIISWLWFYSLQYVMHVLYTHISLEYNLKKKKLYGALYWMKYKLFWALEVK